MTPHNTNRLLILISLFLATASSQKCMRRGFSVQETLPLTSCSESLCPECDYCNDENENTLITTKVDTQTGTLSVFYKLDLAKNYSDLRVQLQVNENHLTSETCRNADFADFTIHSEKKLSLKWEIKNSTALETPCCKILELKFKYIFTGCYFVKVIPYKNSNSVQMPIEDCAKLYVTDYVKEYLMRMTPKFSPQYLSKSLQVVMSIRGDPAYMLVTQHSAKNRHRLAHQGRKACESLSTENACCFFHMDKLTSKENEFECQSKLESSETNCFVVNSSEGTKVVKCIFAPINPGNYCISIEYDDERCERGSVWQTNKTGCLWSHSYEVKMPVKVVAEEARLNPVTMPEKGVDGYIFAVLSVTAVVLLLLIFLMWRKYSSASLVRPTHRFTTLREHLGFVQLERPSVLLLYPRDTPTFMNVMTQFREVLRRANCKVYDCWDPRMEAEVLKNPHSWVQMHAMDSSTRVIVVASQCSLLLERSLLGSNCTLKYFPPSHFDDLFLYGIQCLNENILAERYEKMFVVRLRGPDDTIEVSSLTYINPLTVYSLPLHLEKLILGLLSVDGSQYSIATDCPEVRSFEKALQENSWFMKQNPNYLNTLLGNTHNCPEEDLLQLSTGSGASC